MAFGGTLCRKSNPIFIGCSARGVNAGNLVWHQAYVIGPIACQLNEEPLNSQGSGLVACSV